LEQKNNLGYAKSHVTFPVINTDDYKLLTSHWCPRVRTGNHPLIVSEKCNLAEVQFKWFPRSL